MIIKNKNIFMNMNERMPKSINDFTLKQYLQFTKVAASIQEDKSVESMLNTYKLIEIATNMTEEELDALSVTESNELAEQVKELVVNFNGFETSETPVFTIDSVDYMAKDPQDLDNGEYISLNILKEQYTDTYDLFPRLLAVIIRPATKEYDFETKQERYTLENFNRKDMINLEYRANLFLEKAKAQDVIPVLNFFLSTNKTSV
jgi:hypothetical protein